MTSANLKKSLTINNTSRIQKEYPPTCGKAIPSYANLHDEEEKWSTFQQPLAAPQINSLLRQKEEMQKIESLMPRRYKTADCLTPRSKTAIMPKINQRLNFDVTRPVFKNLTPINVNDSLLLPRERSSIQKKYNRLKSTKAPAPDLADFLDPIKPLTHVIPLPEIVLEFPKHSYDPMEIYECFADNSLLEQSIPPSGIK